MFIVDFILDVLFGGDSLQHEKRIAAVLTKLFLKVWPKSQSWTMTFFSCTVITTTRILALRVHFCTDSVTQMLTEQLESLSHLLGKVHSFISTTKYFYHNHLHMFISLVAESISSHSLNMNIYFWSLRSVLQAKVFIFHKHYFGVVVFH